jgi:hypothetical protein
MDLFHFVDGFEDQASVPTKTCIFSDIPFPDPACHGRTFGPTNYLRAGILHKRRKGNMHILGYSVPPSFFLYSLSQLQIEKGERKQKGSEKGRYNQKSGKVRI